MEQSANSNGVSGRLASAKQRCVLLVEDDGNDVELIRLALRCFDPAVSLRVTYNGREAIEHLNEPASPAPDLILTDINMPIMDGLEFLRWIKTSSLRRRTPVIILTSSVVRRDVAVAFDRGAAGYLVKPPTFEELKAKLEALMLFWSHSECPPDVREEELLSHM